MFYAYVEKHDNSIWRKWEMRMLAFDALRRHVYISAPLPKEWASAVNVNASDDMFSHYATNLSPASITSATTVPLFAATQPSESVTCVAAATAAREDFALASNQREALLLHQQEQLQNRHQKAHASNNLPDHGLPFAWRSMPNSAERTRRVAHRLDSRSSASREREAAIQSPNLLRVLPDTQRSPSSPARGSQEGGVLTQIPRVAADDNNSSSSSTNDRSFVHPAEPQMVPHSLVSDSTNAEPRSTRINSTSGCVNNCHPNRASSLTIPAGPGADIDDNTFIPPPAASSVRLTAPVSNTPHNTADNNSANNSTSDSSRRRARMMTCENITTVDAFAELITGAATTDPQDDEVWPGGPRLSQVVWRRKIKLLQILPTVMGKRFSQKISSRTQSERSFFEFALIGETRALNKGGPPHEPLLCVSTGLHRSAFPAFLCKRKVPTYTSAAASSTTMPSRMYRSDTANDSGSNNFGNYSNRHTYNGCGGNIISSNHSPASRISTFSTDLPAFLSPHSHRLAADSVSLPVAAHDRAAEEEEFLHDPSQLAELDAALRELQFHVRYERQRVIRAARAAAATNDRPSSASVLPDFLYRCESYASAVHRATIDSPRAQANAFAGACESVTLRCRSENEARRLWFVMQSVLGSDGLSQRPFGGRPPYDPRNGVCFAPIPLMLTKPFGAVLNSVLFYVLERGWVMGWRADGTLGALCATSTRSTNNNSSSTTANNVASSNSYAKNKSTSSKHVLSPIAASLMSFSLSLTSSAKSLPTQSCFLCIMHDDVLLLNEKALVCYRVELRRISEVHVGGLPGATLTRKRQSNRKRMGDCGNKSSNVRHYDSTNSDPMNFCISDDSHVVSVGNTILSASERRRGSAWRSSKGMIMPTAGNTSSAARSIPSLSFPRTSAAANASATSAHGSTTAASATASPIVSVVATSSPSAATAADESQTTRTPFIALRTDAPGPDIIFTPLPPHSGILAQSHYSADIVARRIYTVLHDLCFASLCVRRVVKMAVVGDINALEYVRRVERCEDVTRDDSYSMSSHSSDTTTRNDRDQRHDAGGDGYASNRALLSSYSRPRHDHYHGTHSEEGNESSDDMYSEDTVSSNYDSSTISGSDSVVSGAGSAHSHTAGVAREGLPRSDVVHLGSQRREGPIDGEMHSRTRARPAEMTALQPLRLLRQDDLNECRTLTQSLSVLSHDSSNSNNQQHSAGGAGHSDHENTSPGPSVTEQASSADSLSPRTLYLRSLTSMWQEYQVLLQNRASTIPTMNTNNNTVDPSDSNALLQQRPNASIPNHRGLPLYMNTAADLQLQPRQLRHLMHTLSRQRVEEDEVVGMPLHRVHQLLHRHRHHRHHLRRQVHQQEYVEQQQLETSTSPNASCYTMQYVDAMPSSQECASSHFNNNVNTNVSDSIANNTFYTLSSNTPDSNALGSVVVSARLTQSAVKPPDADNNRSSTNNSDNVRVAGVQGCVPTTTLYSYVGAPIQPNEMRAVSTICTDRHDASKSMTLSKRMIVRSHDSDGHNDMRISTASGGDDGSDRRSKRTHHRHRGRRAGDSKDDVSHYGVPGARYLAQEEFEHPTVT